jgi:hypothetical protein
MAPKFGKNGGERQKKRGIYGIEGRFTQATGNNSLKYDSNRADPIWGTCRVELELDKSVFSAG